MRNSYFRQPRHYDAPHSSPTRRSSDLAPGGAQEGRPAQGSQGPPVLEALASRPHASRPERPKRRAFRKWRLTRSEEHTSELQSHSDLVCSRLLEKKKGEIFIVQ